MKVGNIYYHRGLERLILITDEVPCLNMYFAEPYAGGYSDPVKSLLCCFADDPLDYIGEL